MLPPPHPLLFELLYSPRLEEDLAQVLPHLLRIDAAHLVMLAEQGVLPRPTAADLLRVNRELATRLSAGEPALAPGDAHRGLYLLYERHYVERLGPERGGAAHLARSRNDINAAVTRMRLRQVLLDLLECGAQLLGELGSQAGAHAATLMCAFTHLQPAQPSTFGHYLAGVAGEQQRSLEWLAAAFEPANRSPLGAAAGLGTSFPIDRDRVAALLGFAGVIENAADAVASRDYAAYALSGAAVLGVSLTRLALDLQTWASQAYGFLDWPDELVGTSSIMPQKRNAFVLEDIRGQAIHPVGALVNLLLGMKNTPFSNSVEVSGEATAHLWPALRALDGALRLSRLMLARLVVEPHRMLAALAPGQAAMTSLANLLVAHHGIAFRTAHEIVARLAQAQAQAQDGREALAAAEIKARLEAGLRDAMGRVVVVDAAAIEQALDPARCVAAARHGGGPAPDAIARQRRSLARRRRRLEARVTAWRRRLREADLSLAAAIDAVLRDTASPAPGRGPEAARPARRRRGRRPAGPP
jgi:argininosuccinate lyase